jgi:predicted transcriptional regulator
MKTEAIPAVRVLPELRENMQAVLREGETLSAFVESAVREAVQRRLDDEAFIARGMAAAQRVREGAPTITPEEMLKRLQAKIDKAVAAHRQKTA